MTSARRWTTVVLLALWIGASQPASAGASGWSYFAPYQADVAAVLKELRWNVFRSGKYYKLDPKAKPRSPDEALEMNDTEGTHTIIDIGKAASAPADPGKCALGTVCPLPRAKLVELFGTDHPTRAQIKVGSKEELALETMQPRWSGVWITLYEGNAPKWIYFTGFSGD